MIFYKLDVAAMRNRFRLLRLMAFKKPTTAPRLLCSKDIKFHEIPDFRASVFLDHKPPLRIVPRFDGVRRHRGL